MYFTLEGDQLSLALNLVKASIEVVVGDTREVELEFSELRKKTADEMFDINFWDDQLTIKEKFGRKSPMMSSLFDEKLNTDLRLKIPTGITATGFITAVGGRINIGPIQFDGKLKTLNGDMNLSEMKSSRLSTNTVSGDTRIGIMSGALEGHSISGKFLIEGGDIQMLKLRTVSGDIFCKAGLSLVEDGIIQTVSGDIKMKIPHYEGDKELFLSTLSGNTELEGTYPEEKISKKRTMPFMKGAWFKDVMPTIKEFMSSMKGGHGVEVHTQWDSGRKERKENKNVKAILDMLSEGKITPDEAERLINAIKGK